MMGVHGKLVINIMSYQIGAQARCKTSRKGGMAMQSSLLVKTADSTVTQRSLDSSRRNSQSRVNEPSRQN